MSLREELSGKYELKMLDTFQSTGIIFFFFVIWDSQVEREISVKLKGSCQFFMFWIKMNRCGAVVKLLMASN